MCGHWVWYWAGWYYGGWRRMFVMDAACGQRNYT